MTPPDNPASVFFDANAFIDFLLGQHAHMVVAEMLARAEQQKVEVYTSVVSYLEVRGWGTLAFDAAKDKDSRDLLDRPSITKVPLTRAVGHIARDLLAKHRLTNFDAAQLASAVFAEVDVFMTRDQDILTITSVGNMAITKPYLPGAAPGQDMLTGL